jgi:lipopolysaccharide export system protein LptC
MAGMSGGFLGNRFAMIMLLLLSTVAVLASFWVLEVMRRAGEESMPPRQRIEPDYYVENFAYLRQSATPGTRYEIAGKRLEHDPVDGTHHVQLPVLDSYHNDRPPTRSTSKRAIISADNSLVSLYEDVKVDREASATSEAFRLRSEFLQVLTNEDIVRTDKPVQLSLGRSVLHGTGMQANNATRQLELWQPVRAQFAARETR